MAETDHIVDIDVTEDFRDRVRPSSGIPLEIDPTSGANPGHDTQVEIDTNEDFTPRVRTARAIRAELT